MRTILKRNLSWSIIIILCFTVLCCKCKKETNSTQTGKVDSDTLAIELDASEINKANMNLTRSNIKFFVPQIPDSLAAEYVTKYFKIFPDENKFRRVFTMGISAYNNILKEAAVNGKIKLLFTENNGVLDVIYENSNGKKVSINDNDIINDSIYLTMNNAFKGNCYDEMNKAINSLDTSLKENTREIIIPINDLKRLNPSNKSIIVFLPGVTTINTSSTGGLNNQKNYLTLVAFTIEVIDPNTGQIKLERNVIYDNFCVSPPNNC